MKRRRKASAAGTPTISDKDFAAVQRAAVRKAKAGVVSAMNLVDRMRRRGRRVALDLPPITGAESLAEAHARVIAAAACERLSAQDALAFSTLLERRRRALDTVISERTLEELNAANRASAAEPEPPALRPADAAFRRVKKHGHRALALEAAARMEARALEAGPQAPEARGADKPQAKPETTPAAPAVDAKPTSSIERGPIETGLIETGPIETGPIETEPAPPPPEPDPGTQWREEHCRWRPLAERDDHEYDRQYYGIDDDDPLDDP